MSSVFSLGVSFRRALPPHPLFPSQYGQAQTVWVRILSWLFIGIMSLNPVYKLSSLFNKMVLGHHLSPKVDVKAPAMLRCTVTLSSLSHKAEAEASHFLCHPDTRL